MVHGFGVPVDDCSGEINRHYGVPLCIDLQTYKTAPAGTDPESDRLSAAKRSGVPDGSHFHQAYILQRRDNSADRPLVQGQTLGDCAATDPVIGPYQFQDAREIVKADPVPKHGGYCKLCN